MKRFNLNLRPIDLENIRIVMALYPYPQNPTDAIRMALADVVHNADPVALEAARKQARKASKKE